MRLAANLPLQSQQVHTRTAGVALAMTAICAQMLFLFVLVLHV